jgi:cysteine-rich repeat protein
LLVAHYPHVAIVRLDANGLVASNEIQLDSTAGNDRALGPAMAALPSGAVAVWKQDAGIFARRVDSTGQPIGPAFATGIDGRIAPVAGGSADGGFLVAADNHARAFNANGSPRGPATLLMNQLTLEAIGTADGGFALAGVFLTISRLSSTAELLWTKPVGQFEAQNVSAGLALAADFEGHFQLSWAQSEPDSTGRRYLPTRLRARGTDASGIPLAPMFDLGTPIYFKVHALALPDGRYLNLFIGTTSIAANFSSTCGPTSTVCGDGVFYERCEECDDGVANSDVAPDACRTDCRYPRCADSVVDTGEECDDGNTDPCDGCSSTCTIEPGLGCGDGVPVPACGEQCDDANAVAGDGCTTACQVEPIYGGGSSLTDCFSEWVVNNPSNTPLLDGRGNFSGSQSCVDDDPSCDFDGGVPGSCTFHLRVCINNTTLSTCGPETRLSSWTLVKPSAKVAAHDAAAASARAAFAGIAGVVVGPTDRDLCTDDLAVPVPLRGAPGKYRPGKLQLKSAATGYSGLVDTDKLRLTCVPH